MLQHGPAAWALTHRHLTAIARHILPMVALAPSLHLSFFLHLSSTIQVKLTAEPKKQALEMLRKKIEVQNTKVLAVRRRYEVAAQVGPLHAEKAACRLTPHALPLSRLVL